MTNNIQCMICLGKINIEKIINRCNCKNIKYHEKCLLTWISKKNGNKKVCEICKSEYKNINYTELEIYPFQFSNVWPDYLDGTEPYPILEPEPELVPVLETEPELGPVLEPELEIYPEPELEIYPEPALEIYPNYLDTIESAKILDIEPVMILSLESVPELETPKQYMYENKHQGCITNIATSAPHTTTANGCRKAATTTRAAKAAKAVTVGTLTTRAREIIFANNIFNPHGM